MDWKTLQDIEKQKPYYNELYDFIKEQYDKYTCYPPFEQIFTAMNETPFENVKCVILGQDPYHGKGQAMGMSFSVNKGIAIPRSLQNIYKEIHNELGCDIPSHGDLTKWARQGVLLLNTILTVKEKNPLSHAGKGWETFTDAMIKAINESDKPIVFMLWGAKAKAKKDLITNKNHLILTAAHPSPYSADQGFFGCNHFIKCNEFLKKNGLSPIDWQIN